MAAVRYHEKNVKNIKRVFHKNYNLNVTEVRDSDFKNAFPGIFNFIVGILMVERELSVETYAEYPLKP